MLVTLLLGAHRRVFEVHDLDVFVIDPVNVFPFLVLGTEVQIAHLLLA